MAERPPTELGRARLRRLATSDLESEDVATIRAILAAAFGNGEEERFTADDWDHALGGIHFVLDVDGEIVAHASVVERQIDVGGRRLRTGYVEAVATAPDHQGLGLGSLVIADVIAYIRHEFELGALSTGRQGFYARLGWLIWIGPSSVRTSGGARRTPDEDGDIMVLPAPSSPSLDLSAPISCEWRRGDVW